MKTSFIRIGTVLSAVILVNFWTPTPAFCLTWHIVTEDQGQTLEVETSTIENYLVYKEAWIRLNFARHYLRRADGIIVKEMRVHEKFNCIQRKTTTDTMETVDVNNGITSVGPLPDKWSSADPDGPNADVFNYVCDISPQTK